MANIIKYSELKTETVSKKEQKTKNDLRCLAVFVG